MFIHHDDCLIVTVSVKVYDWNDAVDVMNRIRDGLTINDDPDVNVRVIPAA